MNKQKHIYRWIVLKNNLYAYETSEMKLLMLQFNKTITRFYTIPYFQSATRDSASGLSFQQNLDLLPSSSYINNCVLHPSIPCLLSPLPLLGFLFWSYEQCLAYFPCVLVTQCRHPNLPCGTQHLPIKCRGASATYCFVVPVLESI